MHFVSRYGLVTMAFGILGIHTASAQQNTTAVKIEAAAVASTSADSPSQQERAESAMRKALEQQQAAIDRMRDATQANSLETQQASILRQVARVDKSTDSSSGAVDARAQKGAEALASADKPFFALPWTDAAPLTVPNVQVMDDSCEALPQAQVDQLIAGASKKSGVDPGLLRLVMRQESRFKPCATSTAGAMGLMQIMPDTADLLGLDEPYDPAKNVDAGAKYLKMMLDRYKGDTSMALAAYNAGPGRVDKAGGIPQLSETIQYITNILKSLPALY